MWIYSQPSVPGFHIHRFNQSQMEESIVDLQLGLWQIQRVDCIRCSILYKGFEQPWILVSTSVLEPIPEESKVIYRLPVAGWGPPKPRGVMFKGRLYSYVLCVCAYEY